MLGHERDALGDNLVPDYITHVQPGGFYGWPWWYIGAHQDPRLMGTHPDLKDKAIVPDVLLQPHNASLEMTFYSGKQFLLRNITVTSSPPSTARGTGRRGRATKSFVCRCTRRVMRAASTRTSLPGLCCRTATSGGVRWV